MSTYNLNVVFALLCNQGVPNVKLYYFSDVYIFLNCDPVKIPIKCFDYYGV